MKNESAAEKLGSYLNDHLAGSVAALELLERLIETYEKQPMSVFFRGLHDEISSDQDVLKRLIRHLGADESTPRKVVGWIAEKASRPKIALDESNQDQVGLLLALETLVLGITGKHCLWCALAAASKSNPDLLLEDYARLQQRAVEQREMVNSKRLEVAALVFSRMP